MDIQTEKLQLIKRLLDTDDESILQQAKDVFKSHKKDFWNQLSEHVKSGIERSKKQADNGLLTPHEDVMKKYAKYL
jgi:predicted transcriptional regulator